MDRQNDDSMMVSIKEFAEFVGVKQSVLRYYDEIGLFSPADRGDNSYRYYVLPQIQTIKLIETLRGLNIPLKKIEEIMRSRSPESMVELLTKYEIRLNADLRALQESFALIHTLRTQIQGGVYQDENEITIRFLEESRVSLGPLTDFKPGESYHRVFSNYYRIAQRLRVNLSYPIGGYWDTFDEFLESPSRPKRYYSLDPNGIDIMQAANYLLGYTRGDYGVVNDIPLRLQTYASDHRLKVVGPVYQFFPLNELSVENPHDYLSRISVRIDR